MANEEHLKILKQGVEGWNKWREANPKMVPDLSEAYLPHTFLSRRNLRSANLSRALLLGADLSRVTLSGADLSGTDLRKAAFNWADLSEANFSGANLSSADLTMTNLSGAFFGKADLLWANLSGARLFETDLTDARVGFTSFGGVDLRAVKGIEAIRHRGPCFIGIDTIYRSEGRIPIRFLRGAGVPDTFIEYMGSLVGTAFEFYSCFISYSSKDEEFAARIHADLQDNGVRCWFAPHHVQGGKKLHEQIDSAIRLHERLLLILSPESIHSEWVKTEIAKATKREIQEGKRVLFPIRLNLPFTKLGDWEFFDPFIGKDLAREIAEYYIPDFTNWKDHDQYQEEFKKLLRDLKKGDVSAVGA